MALLILFKQFQKSLTRRVACNSCTKESRRMVQAGVRLQVKIISEMQGRKAEAPVQRSSLVAGLLALDSNQILVV